MARGFYSVIQYCPDRFRAEAVNVGLVLLRFEPHAVCVRIENNHERVRKLFGLARPELKDLALATQGLKSRIEKCADDFRTEEDLAAFAATRANDLRLTEPRLAKLANFEEDFDRLYSQLVEQLATEKRTHQTAAEKLPSRLQELFSRLSAEKKLWTPGKITVPVFNSEMEIPYAYQNGVVNYIKPHVFPETKRAEGQAARLAVNGDLIQRNPVDGETRRLIVVSARETPEQEKAIDNHIAPLFEEYHVRLIRPDDVDEFAEEVEASAH